MTRLSILGSGSKGNAALLTTSTTAVLIDCGISARELTRRMALVGRKPEDLDGVILTHEHSDHINGLGVFLNYVIKRGRPVPTYATELCAAQLNFGRVEQPPVVLFQAGRPFTIGDIVVDPFTTPHDSIDPINVVLVAEGMRIGWSTDLGFVPPAMKRKFAGCQVIVLESNHDTDMLANGPHPEDVKKRVAGRFGHLSNDQAAEFLSEIHAETETVILSHLSDDNNDPELAAFVANKALTVCGSKARVIVASQTEVLRVR